MLMEEYLARFVPLIKPSKGFKELKSLIIDTGLCCGCGTCVAFCSRIKMFDLPELVEACTLEQGSIKCSEEGTCYDNCPFITAEFLSYEPLGEYKKIVAARAKASEILANAQDGGVATALAIFALENNYVDAIVGVGRDEEWRARAITAKSREEVLSMVGTKYSKTPVVEEFGRVIKEEKLKKLMVIGLGCQINGIRNLQKNLLKDLVDVILIGLFCFENFPYECLREKIKEEFNLSMSEIVKVDITKGKFIVKTKSGEILKKPVKVFDPCVNDACNFCTNFSSVFSDLSVGSIGSEQGWTTVIVRTERGEKLLEEAEKAGYIEISENVDVKSIEYVAGLKRKKNAATVEKRKEEGLFIPGE
ncbi:MAG: hypothetical protein DRN88_05785 [Candidatus Hydrothermarchaeota archaeon]|nr:MAG: hypothetical protein DRN88_05785 [Candidatus Hydrothermarchaeota archaeon]